MNRLKTSLIAGATLALTATAFAAAPTAAADGATVAIVHGIPKVKVDVCINGKAVVRKNFRYGQKWVLAGLAPAKYNIKVRLAKGFPVCEGPAVIKVKPTLDGTEQWTVVAVIKGGKPDIRLFDNNATLFTATSTAAPASGIIASHAAKAPTVDGYIASVVNLSAVTPTIPGIEKGDSAGAFVEPGTYSVWVSLPGSADPVIGPKNREVIAGKTNHYVAVGTKAKNWRMVFFRTDTPTIVV